MPQLACQIVDLTKEYVLKSETVRALRGVTFEVPEGDYVAIMGPSGSGKSTLLNLLGCLDRPTNGNFYLGGDDVAQMSDDQLSTIRATRIGFVFQSYNLIPQLTVVENIEVPLYYQGRLDPVARRRCVELANLVGHSFPVVSSNAWRLLGASSTIPSSCWLMKQRETWTQ